MSLRLPKCDFCKHYHEELNNGKECCDAFPDGIPLNKMNFDENEDCNNGIKYEKE